MDGFKPGKYMNAVDLIIISYLFDTLILSFFIHTPGGWVQPVIARLLMFVAIGMLLYQEHYFPSRGSRLIHFFYPLLFPAYFYGETALLNHVFFSQSIDPILYHWEMLLFGFQPSEWFSGKYNQLWFSELMSFSYLSYYFFFIGFFVAAYRKKEELQREKIIFYMVQGFILYYVVFILFPSEGPQFYIDGGDVSHQGFFGGILQTIQHFGEKPTGAFPSSHVGMMMVYAYISFIYFKKIFPLTLLFTLLICRATVYIKAHYVVDVVAGILSAPLVIGLTGWFYRMSRNILWEDI